MPMYPTRRWNPSRGGHAPGHVRDWFAALVDGDQDPDLPAQARIIGLLWNCTDIMPFDLCSALGLRAGSTYAQGVRSYRDWEAEMETLIEVQ